MGGRGSFAAGKNVEFVYETAGMINVVKVLQGKGNLHHLPEEAHSSRAYIRLNPDGTFHEMRIYGKDHYLIKEIAYHPEPNLNNGDRHKKVLHVHEYSEHDRFDLRTTRLITKKEYTEYKKFFKGVPEIDKW